MGDGTSDDRDRPRGRSGCVTTPTTSNPSPSSARNGGAANSGVPQKRTLMMRSERFLSVTSRDLVRRKLADVLREVLPHRFPLRERRSSLQKAEIVDEQLSVQVIDLVLQTAREEVSRLELKRLTIAVERANGHARGPLHVAENLRNREAALIGLRGPLGHHDLGVHDDDRTVLDI